MENDKLMYIHPAPVRVWHWVNAVGFIILILTGIQIRFAEMIDLFSLEEAIQVHNYVGFVVIAAYGLWVSYYFGTMKIKLYFPNPRTFVPDALKQIKYYGSGIFKGDPNPHVMTPDHKFNALQQKAYLGIMFVFLPAQMITVLFFWRVKGFENNIEMPAHFGLRHIAGLGITIRTDALSLMVSEETGQISYINNGAFILFEDTQDLIEIIKEDLTY